MEKSDFKIEKNTLYVVGVPIGNMDDITLRAIKVLLGVDFVACEDSRVTGKLLYNLEIKQKMVPYFQHSKPAKLDMIAKRIAEGECAAMVSDAGTPTISDPGFSLISYIQKNYPNVKIVPVPGVSAAVCAISVSGMVSKDFYFGGFLPKKKGRNKLLSHLSDLSIPIVIYESAMRIQKTLGEVKEFFGENTEIFLGREMTKMFEEYIRGDINEVIAKISDKKLLGEIVLIINKKKKAPEYE